MIETDRRGTLALAAALPFASSFSALAASAAEPDAATPAWDLTDLYPDLTAWDAARKSVADALPRLRAYKGTLGQSADAMLTALDDISKVTLKLNRIAVYASLKADEDRRVSVNQERSAQIDDLFATFSQAIAWTSPEIQTLGKDKVTDFLAANATLRRRFGFLLRDTLRQAEHTLDNQGEAILAAVSSPLAGPEQVRGQLVSSDLPWKTVTLSSGKSVRLDDQGYANSRDADTRADRKLIFDTFWASYAAFSNTLGANLATKLRGDVFQAQTRKFPNSLSMALSGNNIPEGVYRTLVAQVNEGLPQLHRYFQLRRRMLNLPDIHYYDIYVPLVTLDRAFTLEQMRALTLGALAPLGRLYVNRLAEATAAKWMDPLPRTGKASGAYMAGSAYDVHPYLLLNLGQNYEGLSTYAHEWGHAMHTLLTNQNQPFEMSDYPTFTAEIASTCNELLLNAYMLSRATTRQEKLYYLGMKLDLIRGTFFRQTMFAEFELKIHEMAEAGEGLSGESFTRVYLDLLKRYHGPQFVMDEAYAAEWAYVPHFFRFFYVYQYATSITAGAWFARSLTKGGAKARERYLDVLRAGGSDYPVEILKRAGLDMTSAEPYRGIVSDFADTLDQIEKLLG